MLHSLYKEMDNDDIFHTFDGFWSYVTFIENKPIVYTDFLSIKPVYYRTDIEAMASEPNALLALGSVTPNMLHLSNVMKWGYDPTGATAWNEIKQLKAGHYLYDGVEIPYWDWTKVTLTTLRDDLSMAVANRLSGFRDISILLSGGLDSTIIYELAKQMDMNITPIHVNNKEKDFASLVCKNLVEVSLDNVTDREAKMFFNGAEPSPYNDGPSDGGGTVGTSNTNAFEIGKANSVTSHVAWIGEMAMVKWHDKQLNATESLANYNATKATFGL